MCRSSPSGKDLTLLRSFQRKTELEKRRANWVHIAHENNPLLTPEQKEEQIAAIKAESEYIRITSELAEIDLRLKALGTDWDHLREEMRKQRSSSGSSRKSSGNSSPITPFWRVWWRRSPPEP